MICLLSHLDQVSHDQMVNLFLLLMLLFFRIEPSLSQLRQLHRKNGKQIDKQIMSQIFGEATDTDKETELVEAVLFYAWQGSVIIEEFADVRIKSNDPRRIEIIISCESNKGEYLSISSELTVIKQSKKEGQTVNENKLFIQNKLTWRSTNATTEKQKRTPSICTSKILIRTSTRQRVETRFNLNRILIHK